MVITHKDVIHNALSKDRITRASNEVDGTDKTYKTNIPKHLSEPPFTRLSRNKGTDQAKYPVKKSSGKS